MFRDMPNCLNFKQDSNSKAHVFKINTKFT